MKIVLEKVKIYGFDPTAFKTFADGKTQYSVALIISQKQRELIDSYIYGKCEITRDEEIVFYGKNKNPIPVFDQNRNKIEKPINEVFLADVSILIDEFEKDGETIRYTKCLGIHYISPIANETPRIISKDNYVTFDEIFGESENNNQLSSNVPKDDIEQMFEAPKKQESIFEPTVPEMDDLPF